MIRQSTPTLAELYDVDETAWLDVMSDLVREGRLDDLDLLHLGEYLSDMAASDRREVESRLTILMMHVLKWLHQTDKRTSSWRRTISEQRKELGRLLKSGALRQHAEAALPEMYTDAVELAADETELPEDTFPSQCPWTLDQILSREVLSDGTQSD